jgi:hypothetical protein
VIADDLAIDDPSADVDEQTETGASVPPSRSERN